MDASNTRLRSWEGSEGRTKEYLNYYFIVYTVTGVGKAVKEELKNT